MIQSSKKPPWNKAPQYTASCPRELETLARHMKRLGANLVRRRQNKLYYERDYGLHPFRGVIQITYKEE